MNNKVLVKLNVLELDNQYDMFIPVNEVVWKVKKLILKALSDMVDSSININESYVLMNKDNSKVYSNNELIINTDIRNATELVLFKDSK